MTQGTNSLSYIADSVEVRGYKLDLQLKKVTSYQYIFLPKT